MFALNTPCKLKTTGDWHRCCFDWNNPEYAESDGSLWGAWGIEMNSRIPMLNGAIRNKANHLRALLDLLAQNRLLEAQGIKDDFICCDEYTEIFFEQVVKLRSACNWANVCSLMYREYRGEWRRYLQRHGISAVFDANYRVNHL